MTQLELFDLGASMQAPANKRDRRLITLNLDIVKDIEFTSSSMPIVRPSYHTEPLKYWQLFSQATNSKTRNVNAGVFFFQDDYKFERVWTNPNVYCSILSNFPYVAGPDFSLYADMPLEMQRWNVFRNRLLSAYWQSNGIDVIPTITWSTASSFDFCFDGISGGTVIISTVGVLNNEQSKRLWIGGASEMVNRINPQYIIVYGHPIKFDFTAVDVTYIDYITKKGGASNGR